MKRVIVLLVALLAFASAARAENLLQNPSFDEGSEHWQLDMWLAGDAYTRGAWTEEGLDGGGLFVENLSDNDARFVQTVAVQPETDYLLSGFVRTQGALSGGGAGLSVLGYANAKAHVADTDGQWQKVALYFRTAAGQKQVTVAARVGFYGGETSGAARFDSLSLTAVGSVPAGTYLARLEDDSAQAAVDAPENAPRWAVLGVAAAAFIVAMLLFRRYRRFDFRIPYAPPDRTPPLRFSRRELLVLAMITAVYGAVAFFQLGDRTAPVTGWSGSGAVLDLGEKQNYTLMLYAGINQRPESDVVFETSDDGVTWTSAGRASVEDGDCFTWKRVTRPILAADGSVRGWTDAAQTFASRYLRLTGDVVSLFEVGILSEEGIPLRAQAVNAQDAALCDEWQTVPDAPSYMNGMYFDEIYHARTAYEHLHALPTYEYTHPPLGKLLIALGVSIFGMNPFGWRFMGTLAGVLMIPAMFLLARLLFQKSWAALLAAFLLAADEMHLAQTRIATIDSFAVLFILLMTACMIRYMQMNCMSDGYRTLVPLGFSGLFMGLACASKWTGAYGALGIAVLFFWTVAQRIAEALRAQRCLPAEKVLALRRLLVRRLSVTLACCVLFFVIVPLTIYYLSYIPHFAYAGGLTPERFVREQERMLEYHATLTGTHSYESRWFEWPLTFRPVWYYMGKAVPEGFVSTIQCAGNPAVWWPSAVAVLLLCGLWLRRVWSAGAGERAVAIILIGFFAQYVPWAFVGRMTFLYHYFASLPFAILALVYILTRFCARGGKAAGVLVAVYALATLVLFILFLPFVTGLLMPRDYADALNWFKELYLPWWPFAGWLRY